MRRALSLYSIGLLAAALLPAQTADKFAASREAAVYNGPTVKAAMWIWSDKYTYQPGQSLILRWTTKTNGDVYPYTIFVYRQNNQTGAKTYYPSLSSTPSDIAGNTQTQGFQAQALQDRSKAVLLGAGGISAAVTIPSELGMHTFVVELRDYNGGKPLKTAYMKIGVVSGNQTITGSITSSRTLTSDTQWNIQGLVYVKDGAVLTIEPGTFVVGLPGNQPDVSTLIISRTGTIEARGTAARPIVMTSGLPFGQRSRGDWGGLVVLGRAQVNIAAGAQLNNPNAGEGYIEGLPTVADALYGGGASPDNSHYCGTLTYIRVEYAGFERTPGNELNSFTFGGCGTKTVAHHLQASYGQDDDFEWFGGTMNSSYLVGGLGRDDCLDYQLGTTGKVQFALCYESPAANGARGIEGDNNGVGNELAEPFSDPQFYNVTLVGIDANGFEDNPTNGIHLRRGTRGSFNNFVIYNWRGPGILINADAAGTTIAQANAGRLKLNGILLWKANLGGTTPSDTLAGNIGTGAGPAQTITFLQGTPAGAAQNIIVADPQLTRPLEYSDPDWQGLFSSPIFRTGWVQPPDDGFYDQSARFLGGIGEVNWTEGWTSFLVEADIQ